MSFADEPRQSVPEDGPKILEQFEGLPELVAFARRATERGDFGEAYASLTEAAYGAIDAGFPPVALELTRRLREILPKRALTPADRAWLLNVEGLAQSQMRAPEEAEAAWTAMRAIGVRIKDRYIVSIADLNLGNLAHLRGELDRAQHLYRRSARAKLEIGDYRGMAQVLLNLAGLAIELDQLRRAQRILSDTEGILNAWRDPPLHFTLAFNQGRVAAAQQDYRSAERYFRRALTFARRSGDTLREIRALQNLGVSLADQGRAAQALRWLQRGAQLAEISGVTPIEEELQRTLAGVLHRAGNNEESRRHFARAATLARELGDLHGWATMTADAGAAALMVGELEEGIYGLQEALPTIRELGDAVWERRVLQNLIEAYRLGGDFKALDQAVTQMLELLPEPDHRERGSLLRQAAAAWCSQAEGTARAVSYFEYALDEQARYLDATALAGQTALAGASLRDAGALREALPFFDRALTLFDSLEDEVNAFHTHNDRAIILAQLGREEEGQIELERCLTLAHRRDDRPMELQASMNLGEIERRRQNPHRALELLQRAIVLARELADADAEADALSNLGLTLVDLDEPDEAEEAFRSARTLARQRRDAGAEAQAVRGLGDVAWTRGRTAAAQRLFARAARLWEREKDTPHVAEALGALVQCASVRGRGDDLAEFSQRLVDCTREIGQIALAVDALTLAAPHWFQRMDVDTAASLYAAAIALTVEIGSDEPIPATDASDGIKQADDPEADLPELFRPLIQLSVEMALEVLNLVEEDQDHFWRILKEGLNRDYSGIGDLLEPLLSSARETMVRTAAEMQRETVEASANPGGGAVNQLKKDEVENE